jgi:hypothetical protein
VSVANCICRDDQNHVFSMDAVRFAHRHPARGLRLFANVGRLWGRSVKEAAAAQRFSFALAGRSMLHSDLCSCSRYTASAGNACSTMSAEKWATIAASNPRRQ